MHPNVRSSHPELFCEKFVLKYLAKFTGKHQCQSLFFNKVAVLRQLYSKRGFGTGAFLWILRNIYEHFFYRNHPVVTFWICFHLDYLLLGSYYLLRIFKVSVADIEHVFVCWKTFRIITDIFQILKIPHPENTGTKLKVINRNFKARREIC